MRASVLETNVTHLVVRIEEKLECVYKGLYAYDKRRFKRKQNAFA